MAPKTLLFIIVLCFALTACNKQDKQNEYSEYDYDGIEVIVVSRTPGGAYAEENSPSKSRGIGWYDIGLSKNGNATNPPVIGLFGEVFWKKQK